MKNIVFIFLSIFLFTQCTNESKDGSLTGDLGPTVGNRSLEEMCVASWNVQLLNAPQINWADFFNPFANGVTMSCPPVVCNNRAMDICEQIGALMTPLPDIFNIQEAFEPQASQILIDCMTNLGYAYNTNFDFPDGSHECDNQGIVSGFAHKGSGLITFSKWPIKSSFEIDFLGLCHGCMKYGSDCWADKAALVSTIAHPSGCDIVNINTHLESGGTAEDIAARQAQIAMIGAYINSLPSTTILTMSGDWNTRRFDSQYPEMMTALGIVENVATIAGVPDQHTTYGLGGKTIDYIFANDNITSATYDVLFESTVCFWIYAPGTKITNDEIAIDLGDGTSFPIEIKDDPNEPIIWMEYDDIPEEYKDLVVHRCRYYSQSTLSVETCTYQVPVYHVLITDAINPDFDIIEADITNTIITFHDASEIPSGGKIVETYYYDYDDYQAVPDHLKRYAQEICVVRDYLNPSDHTPVLSCMEFNCN